MTIWLKVLVIFVVFFDNFLLASPQGRVDLVAPPHDKECFKNNIFIRKWSIATTAAFANLFAMREMFNLCQWNVKFVISATNYVYLVLNILPPSLIRSLASRWKRRKVQPQYCSWKLEPIIIFGRHSVRKTIRLIYKQVGLLCSAVRRPTTARDPSSFVV